jgi:hypothetical protein
MARQRRAPCFLVSIPKLPLPLPSPYPCLGRIDCSLSSVGLSTVRGGEELVRSPGRVELAWARAAMAGRGARGHGGRSSRPTARRRMRRPLLLRPAAAAVYPEHLPELVIQPRRSDDLAGVRQGQPRAQQPRRHVRRRSRLAVRRRGARRGARGGRAASSTVPTPQQSVTDPIYLAPPLPSYVHPVQRAMPVVTAGSS